jgi:hypothetical protein
LKFGLEKQNCRFYFAFLRFQYGIFFPGRMVFISRGIRIQFCPDKDDNKVKPEINQNAKENQSNQSKSKSEIY